MSYASTNIGNVSVEEDYVSPTTDVWPDESDPLYRSYQSTQYQGGLIRWAVPITRNIGAFEAVDAEEDVKLDKMDADEFREFLLVLSWFLRSTTHMPEALPHIPSQKWRALSRQWTFFSPDFFDIRRCARYVMGSTPVSIVEREHGAESERDVPIIIHPEVICEAEDKALAVDLESSIGLAREAYPTLNRIEVTVEHDPEILDRRTIRFALSVSGDPETILRSEGVFKRRLRSEIDIRARELITITYSWDG